MPANELNARVRHKRDTDANWAANNPVLLDGEIIIVKTGGGERKKVGDGVKRYAQLPFDDEGLIPKHNLTAVVKPTEDDYEGYAPGSIWLCNIVADNNEQTAVMFICVSVVGNKAVWVRCLSKPNAFFLNKLPRQPDTDYVVLPDEAIEGDRVIMA